MLLVHAVLSAKTQFCVCSGKKLLLKLGLGTI